MKKGITIYLSIIAIFFCIANLIYLSIIQFQINDVSENIQSLKNLVNKITEVPKWEDDFKFEDEYNFDTSQNTPNSLQDVIDRVIDRIDEAEMEIKSELNYRYY